MRDKAPSSYTGARTAQFNRQASNVDTLYRPSPFWTRWLLMVGAAVAVFGLTLVAAPSLSSQAFSLLVYADVGRLAFWQNGILNVCFLALFAIPLMATRKVFHITTPDTSLERTPER